MGFSRKTSNNWPQVDTDHRDSDRFRPRHGSDNGRRDSEDRSFTEHGSMGGQTPRSIRHFSPGPKSAVLTSEERSIGPSNELARHLLEASHAFTKLQNVQQEFNNVSSQTERHKEHFNQFPAMREKYEGNMKKKEDELVAAKAHFEATIVPLNDDLKLLVSDKQQSLVTADVLTQVKADMDKELAEVTAFTRRLSQELKNSTLTQYVGTIAKAHVPKPAPSIDVEPLKKEITTLRKRDERREKDIASMHDHFERKFKEMDERWSAIEKNQQTLDTTLVGIQTGQEKTTGELEQVANAVNEMMAGMGELENSVAQADTYIKSANGREQSNNDVTTKLADAVRRIESIQKNVDEHKDAIKSVQSRMTEVNGVLQDGIGKEVIKAGNEGPSSGITEQRLEEVLTQRYEDMWTEITGQFEATYSKLEEIETSADETKNRIEQLWTELESFKTTATNALSEVDKRFGNMFGNMHNKFALDNDGLAKAIQAQEQRVEGLNMAVKQCDERMTEWSTKDFYENLVHLILQRNPVLLNQGAQLNILLNEHRQLQAHLGKVQSELDQRQRSLADGRSPQVLLESPANQIKSGLNGVDSTGSNGSKSVSELKASVETLKSELDRIKTELENGTREFREHVATYNQQTNDIKEWTASATKRLMGNQEQTDMIREEITNIRQAIARRDSSSPHLASPALSGDRWRAVAAAQQEPLRGLGEARDMDTGDD